MPKELRKLKGILTRALHETAPLWPAVQTGFGLVHQAATILANHEQSCGTDVRQRYREFLTAMNRIARESDAVTATLNHFLKVTASYEGGLFCCYDVADLPRTNNALEQLFGATRHHERRCTGRKAASPALVLRGSVRIVASLGTRCKSVCGDDLAAADHNAWRTTRAALDQRRMTRVWRRRFRHNPTGYLRDLEVTLLKPALPP